MAFRAGELGWLRDDVDKMEFFAESGLDRKLIREISSTSMVTKVGALITAQVRAISTFHMPVGTIEIFVRAYHSSY